MFHLKHEVLVPGYTKKFLYILEQSITIINYLHSPITDQSGKYQIWPYCSKPFILKWWMEGQSKKNPTHDNIHEIYNSTGPRNQARHANPFIGGPCHFVTHLIWANGVLKHCQKGICQSFRAGFFTILAYIIKDIELAQWNIRSIILNVLVPVF